MVKTLLPGSAILVTVTKNEN